jgi:hypothetical protein
MGLRGKVDCFYFVHYSKLVEFYGSDLSRVASKAGVFGRGSFTARTSLNQYSLLTYDDVDNRVG